MSLMNLHLNKNIVVMTDTHADMRHCGAGDMSWLSRRRLQVAAKKKARRRGSFMPCPSQQAAGCHLRLVITELRAKKYPPPNEQGRYKVR